MENKNNCNQSNTDAYPYSDKCFQLGSISDVLRSPRVFDPYHALNNLSVLKCGYVGVKAAVLNYLYQVSDIYEFVNNSMTLSTTELKNLEARYKDVVNELLASITTSVSHKLSDCSRMIAYDLYWVDDLEEQDDNIEQTDALFVSNAITFSTINDVETVVISQSSTEVKKLLEACTIDKDNGEITIDQAGAVAGGVWNDISSSSARTVYFLYDTTGAYLAILYYKSTTGTMAGSDQTFTFSFNNQKDISNFDDGSYIITNWGPTGFNSTTKKYYLDKNYTYFLYDSQNPPVSQAYLHWQETTGDFLAGTQQVTFRLVKKTQNVTVDGSVSPYLNNTLFTISGPSYNALKIKMGDLPILAYKAFDVVFKNTSITTYCDRPSMQLLADSSTYSVVLRTAQNSKWTPVGIDNYGRSGNTMYSQVSRKNADTHTYVLCPSTELRSRADPTNINQPLIPGGIRSDGTLVPDSETTNASGIPDTTFRAFGNRGNAQIFLESILTPETDAPSVEFDISENDLVYFLGFLDAKIRQTELISHSIKTKLEIDNTLCKSYNV